MDVNTIDELVLWLEKDDDGTGKLRNIKLAGVLNNLLEIHLKEKGLFFNQKYTPSTNNYIGEIFRDEEKKDLERTWTWDFSNPDDFDEAIKYLWGLIEGIDKHTNKDISEGTVLIPVGIIDRSESQKREKFELESLAASMNLVGQAQAIQVRRRGERFVLLDGERRLRAAQKLHWTKIRAEIISEEHALEDLFVLLTSSQKNGLSAAATAEAIMEIRQKVKKENSYIGKKILSDEAIKKFANAGTLDDPFASCEELNIFIEEVFGISRAVQYDLLRQYREDKEALRKGEIKNLDGRIYIEITESLPDAFRQVMLETREKIKANPIKKTPEEASKEVKRFEEAFKNTGRKMERYLLGTARDCTDKEREIMRKAALHLAEKLLVNFQIKPEELDLTKKELDAFVANRIEK